MDPSQNVLRLLHDITSPHTGVIKRAEEELNALLKAKEGVLRLFEALVATPNDSNAGIRQLAAVLLRRKLPSVWSKLTPAERETCKRVLLESVAQEPNRLVRTNKCYAVAALAKHVYSSSRAGGTWPELLLFLRTATMSPLPESRESGFLIMFALAETLALSLREELPQVAQLYGAALESETDTKVRVAVLRASCALIEALSEDEEAASLFKDLIPRLVGSLETLLLTSSSLDANHLNGKDNHLHRSEVVMVLSQAEEEAIVQTIECLQELIDSSISILDASLGACTLLLARLTAARTLPPPIRSSASIALSEIIKSKPFLVAKSRDAMAAVLEAGFLLALEASEREDQMDRFDEDEEVLHQVDGSATRKKGNASGDGDEGAERDDDDQELSPKDMCEMLVDAAASSLPAKKIAEPLLGRAFTMVSAWMQSSSGGRGSDASTGMQGDSATLLRSASAGLMILVLGIEGLSDFLRSSPEVFERLLHTLLALATSPGSISTSTTTSAGFHGKTATHKRSERNPSELLERFACLALGEMVGNLPEEMLAVSEEVISAISKKYSIVGTHGDLMKLSHALSRVLDEFCEVLDQDQLAPHVPQLYGAIAEILRSPPSPREALDAVALASKVAISADTDFKLERCLELFSLVSRYAAPPQISSEGALDLSNRAHVLLRAQTVALVGHLLIVAENCVEDEREKSQNLPPASPAPLLPENPFLPHILELLSASVFARTDILELREAACEFVGHLAVALKSPRVDAFVPALVPSLLVATAADEDDVRLSTRGGAIEGEVPEGITRILDGGGVSEAHGGENDDQDDDDDDEEFELPNQRITSHVKTAAADAKSGALYALQMLYEHAASSAMSPYFDDTFRLCEGMTDYPDEGVRAQALMTMTWTAISQFATQGGSEAVFRSTALRGGGGGETPSDRLRALAQSIHNANMLTLDFLPGLHEPETSLRRTMEMHVLPCLLEGMRADRSKTVAARACECLSEIFVQTGPYGLGDASAAELVSALCDILLHRVACNMGAFSSHHNDEIEEDDENDEVGRGNNRVRGGVEEEEEADADDDGEEEDEQRHDATLVESAMEAIDNLSQVLWFDFAAHVPRLLKILFRYSKGSRGVRDRVASAGVMCHLAQRTPAEVWRPFLKKSVKLAIRCVEQEESEALRRNGLFMCGILCESCGADAKSGMAMLTAMNKVFALDLTSAVQGKGRKNARAPTKWLREDLEAVFDNACGAVCRMVLRDDLVASGFPVGPIMNAVVRNLPLKYDHEEDWVVYEALSKYRSTVDASRLRVVLTGALGDRELDPVARDFIMKAFGMGRVGAAS